MATRPERTSSQSLAASASRAAERNWRAADFFQRARASLMMIERTTVQIAKACGVD